MCFRIVYGNRRRDAQALLELVFNLLFAGKTDHFRNFFDGIGGGFEIIRGVFHAQGVDGVEDGGAGIFFILPL